MGEHYLRSRFMSVLDAVGARVASASHALDEYRAAVVARGGGTSAYSVWNAFQSARVFHVPSAELAERHSAAGGTAFAYLFKWRPRSLRRAVGACHALDVPFVFGLDNHTLTKVVGSLSGSAPQLSKRMQDAWIAFIRGGAPDSDMLPEWEPYCGEHRATMLLGRQCYVADSPLDRERELITQWLS
jgi:para-nitrobenzyl esterase